MKNLSIARRLQAMIACAIVALVVLAASGAQVAGNLRGAVDYISTNTLPSIEAIGKINEDFLKLRLLVLYHIAQQEPAKKISLEPQIDVQKEKIRQGLANYEKELLSDAKDKELLDTDRKYFETYFTEITPALEKSRANDQAGVWDVVTKATSNMTQLTASIEAHKKFNEQLADAYRKSSEASDQRGQYIALVLIALSIAGVGCLGFFLLRGINKALQTTQTAIAHIESNLDFTHRVAIHGEDELGMMAKALNRLLDKMQGNLKSIAAGAESVASSANLMSTTSNQVAVASHQQSEAASSMAATVEEMTVSINHVADRAQETSRLASDSGKLASSGERVIGQTASDIQEIANTVHEAAELIHGLEQHSQEISNVLQVIKEVADQTNLLALNAAIEAARAGEQGRGFAVVADEVRKLAERTSTSTKEISSTIDAMRTSAGNAVSSMQGVVAKVGKGVERAQEANDSMRQIGEGARGAVGMISEIAEAIREQGSATNNIATQVERIAQMSEESSAAASNSAQAALELDRLASDMQRVVSTYRL